jgi:cell division protein FtsB
MSGRHRTSAIARPNAGVIAAHPSAGRHRSRRDRHDRTLFDDFTRPTEVEHQLVTGRSNRWVLGLLGVAVVGALLAALFVLPVQGWLRQQDDIAVKEQELAVLNGANDELAAEVQHLETVEGAREAARDELSVIDRGEERVSILPTEPGALPLPAGWPYDAVTQIVAVRTTPPTTVALTPAPTSPATTVASIDTTVPAVPAAPATVAATAPLDPAATLGTDAPVNATP